MAELRQQRDWTQLDFDIRILVWRFAYDQQEPRLVEVRTAVHDHYTDDHSLWCPRYSPSPPPTIVNVCHEAREEAQRCAGRAGHFILAGGRTTGAGIYFNPTIDTLYVPNEKDYWIRDWGPEGILTQGQHEDLSYTLQSLAISLEPITRASSGNSLLQDIEGFQSLKDLYLVVKEPTTEILDLVRKLDGYIRWNLVVKWERQPGGPAATVRTVPNGCQLAVRGGGYLRLVEEWKTQNRRRLRHARFDELFGELVARQYANRNSQNESVEL